MIEKKLGKKLKKSLCYKKKFKTEALLCMIWGIWKKCFWVRKKISEKKDHQSKVHLLWLYNTEILKKLNKKKYCVLVCFFCMTVKMKIFAAPLRKNGLKKTHYQEKKVCFWFFIIKCLIFLPTLNYCISLSMNENSLCYEKKIENPPP